MTIFHLSLRQWVNGWTGGQQPTWPFTFIEVKNVPSRPDYQSLYDHLFQQDGSQSDLLQQYKLSTHMLPGTALLIREIFPFEFDQFNKSYEYFHWWERERERASTSSALISRYNFLKMACFKFDIQIMHNLMHRMHQKKCNTIMDYRIMNSLETLLSVCKQRNLTFSKYSISEFLVWCMCFGACHFLRYTL